MLEAELSHREYLFDDVQQTVVLAKALAQQWLTPQHIAVPLFKMPQVCSLPALIWVKASVAGTLTGFDGTGGLAREPAGQQRAGLSSLSSSCTGVHAGKQFHSWSMCM